MADLVENLRGVRKWATNDAGVFHGRVAEDALEEKEPILI